MAEWTSNHVKAIDIGEAVDLGTMEPKYTTNTSVVFRKSGLFRVTVDENRTIIEEVPEFDMSCKGCKDDGKWENEFGYGYPCLCLRCVRRAEDYYEEEGEDGQ